jgi:chemotaxis protein methyltransferase CheR
VNDRACADFLRWALPHLQLSPPGFRRVRGQVCKRLGRRLKALGLGDVDAYRHHLEAHPNEWGVLEGLCRISVSRFYRDAVVFDHLRDQVLPALARAARHRGARSLAAWSAGCAAGEEPYTLLLAWRFAVAPQFPGLDLRIVATDADAHALERARAGWYRPSSVKQLPRAWLEAFQPGDGRLCLDAGLRQQVEFRQHDLREAPPDGPFDLVLCRNLLFTYFEEPLRTQVAEQVIDRLAPGGVLVIGAREGMDHARLGLQPVAPFVPGVYLTVEPLPWLCDTARHMTDARSPGGATTSPVRDQNLVSRKVAGETLVLPIRAGAADLQHLFVLNDTAAWIWERLDGRRGIEQLAGELATEFEVDETRAREDIERLLAQLSETGLVHYNND